MASRKRINLTNSSSKSIKSFFSISREKVDGGRSWWWSGKWDEKKLLTIFIAHILLVLFALLRKIISSVNDIRNKSYMNCGNKMKMKKWSSRWTQFMQLRKETWKNSGLQWGLNPWPCDTGVMLYQLSYDTTDVGSRSRYKICWRYMRLGDTSSWQSIFMGISQESILGLLSFNIVMNDLPCSITM